MLRRLRSKKGSIAEFSVVIYVLFIIVMFPFIDLLSLGTDAAVIYLTALKSATKASFKNGFYEAINAVIQESQMVNNTALSKFTKLTPVGGLSGNGINLRVVASNCRNSKEAPHFFPVNTPPPPPIDTSTYVYEYSAEATYDMEPMIPMRGIPFLKDVPGLGTSARLRMSAQRALEHPESLASIPIDELSGGQASNNVNLDAPSARTPGEWDSPSAESSGWNFPTIYDAIKNAGQEVLAEDVVTVNATNENWTNTTIVTKPGQTVWIDSKSTGTWTGNPSGDLVDADGGYYLGGSLKKSDIFYLEGGVRSGGATSPVSSFKVGKTLMNYPIQSTGTFSLHMKDWPGWYSDNRGAQKVRVILTGPA